MTLYIMHNVGKRTVTLRYTITQMHPQRAPLSTFTVQIIFSFRSFEIGERILRNRKIIFGFGSFSHQRLLYTHGNKLGNTFSSSEMFQKSIFLLSGDTEIFITCISYLGLATGQFMDIHNILSLCYGGHNVP